ncbi:MAG: GAF domain-containing sensor histidine kinase [Aggregatilineales bacterium]
MTIILGLFTLLIIALHAGLGVFVWMRRTLARGDLRWLYVALGLSALASGIYFIPPETTLTDTFGRGVPLALVSVGILIAFGGYIITDLVEGAYRTRLLQIFSAAGGALIIGLLATTLLTDPVQVGTENWLVLLFTEPDASGIVTFAGILLFGFALIAVGLYQFYMATLPEIANRALFWVMNTAILMLSVSLISSGTTIIAELGMVALLIAFVGTVYATTYHMVFDIRGGIILSLRSLLFVGIAFALILMAIYFAVTTSTDVDNADTLAAIALGALIIAALLVPIRQAIEFIIRQLMVKQTIDAAEATRIYGKQVTETVELNALVKEVISTLNGVMRVRRSCLLLLNSTFKVKDAVELLVMQPGGSKDQMTGFVSNFSPIYAALAATRKPISQFDIEYAPEFRTVDAKERDFFRDLNMSAYAPIISENSLIGVLAVGPMQNDTAFFPRDLQLLMTFAQQTGVALRNARLLDDLKHLNKSMESLNRGLKVANEQLNKMDAVKTDFITIASHELRTPLAQIRGYTDIFDAMNEQGLLDQQQANGLVGNLRKATERMEELIAAMLDVSQLDVNAMDLSLTESPLESIVRMAIEPLSDAINQRKLSLTARGLRGLPNIQADLQRLVQAFRNVIVNSIKFTPDGGRIEIIASLESADTPDGTDYINIAITDTGVGIDKKNLELVFQKFFRAYDPSLHSTGTYKFMGAGPGLGLTIAKGVIEGHGGRVWAESPGHNMETYPGTTFFVRLPVNTPDDAKRIMTIEDDSERLRETAIKSPKVSN